MRAAIRRGPHCLRVPSLVIMLLRLFLPPILLSLSRARAQSFPAVIPGVESASPIEDQPFELLGSLDIVIDTASAETRDTDGLTLIPPSTHEFAQTFANDLHTLFPNTTANISVGTAAPLNGVFITTNTGNFTLASGISTSEGYTLDVSSQGITISGAGARGTFWATRTLLQALILNNGSLPASTVRDGPSWETRGFMLGAVLSSSQLLSLSPQHQMLADSGILSPF